MKILVNILLLSLMVFLYSCAVQQNIKSSGVQLTQKLTLIDGYRSMEYRYMEFKTDKGDSLYSEVFDTCFTPAGYKELWDSVGPPLKILPKYLNKKFNVTYRMDSIFSPFN